MAGKQEPQRPIDRMRNADSGRYLDFCNRESIVAQLQRRRGVEQVEAVMCLTGESQSQTEAAGPRCELTDIDIRRKAAIPCHLCRAEPAYRLECAQQDAPSSSLRLARHIHAEVAAINCIHISVSGLAKHDQIAGSGAAMRVGCRIRRIVVRTQVCLHFNNPARDWSCVRVADQQLSKQTRSYVFRRCCKKPSLHQPAGCASLTRAAIGGPRRVRNMPTGALPTHFCCLFHSLIRASTSSAWPSGVTLGKMCSSFWSGPMTKVVRSIPITFLPYMFFSFRTPN